MERESHYSWNCLYLILFSGSFLYAMESGPLCIQKQEFDTSAIKSQLVDVVQDLSSCAYTLHEKLFSNVSSDDAQKALCAIQEVMLDIFDVTKKSQEIEHREHLEHWQRLGYREELADDCAYIKEIFEHLSPTLQSSDEMCLFMRLLEKCRAACWLSTMQDKVEPWLNTITPYVDTASGCTTQKTVLPWRRVCPPDCDAFQKKLTCVVSEKMNRYLFPLVLEMLKRDDPIPTLLVTPATPRT